MNSWLLCVFSLVLMVAASTAQRGNFHYNPGPPQPKPSGNIKYGVDAARGGGAKVYVNGRQEVFNNGRTRGEVYGGADRTFKGPDNGQQSYKVGGKVEHTWGK